MISVLVINLNNFQLTKDCIDDLMCQSIDFNLTVIDQNSTEEGTYEFLNQIEDIGINVIRNNHNRYLNHVWNDFVENSKDEYICLLNNDVRICDNFLSSAIQVFELESKVGFVNHATNHSNFKNYSDELKYAIIDRPYRQGWDMIFRKDCFNKIPEQLRIFYGDDYIYSKLYSSGMKGAYVLNSPMIHYCSQTTVEKGGIRDISNDKNYFFQLELDYYDMTYIENFSSLLPNFNTEQFLKSIKYHNFLKNF